MSCAPIRCPHCGVEGQHLVAPHLGEPAYYTCHAAPRRVPIVGSLLGMPLAIDPEIPPGEAHFVDDKGITVGKIVGLAQSPPREGEG